MADQDYVFVVEWYDTAAALIRKYNMTYHLKDNTIELYDVKNKRIFLKRCQYAGLGLKDIYIGAVLNVYSRQLKVVDYCDAFTKNKFQNQKGKTFAMIKPDGYMHIGKIIDIVESSGFTLGNLKMAKITTRQAEAILADQKGKPNFKNSVEFLTSDLVVGMELIADNCTKKLSNMIGNQNPNQAKSQQPNSIRAYFGTDSIQNAIHGSQSAGQAAKDLQFFFSSKSTINCPAIFNNCTCCVIKPHIISEGYLGQIIDMILSAGFEISAMQMFWMDRASSEEFLQVYKNVVPQFNQLVEQLTNGPCIAMQIRQENAVAAFRQLCGPHDPQMARTVRPKSIRAKFGKDKVKNAIHCTDLTEDGLLQVEYFFNILQSK